ncbi:transposase [Streptomyces klenkii]|uniref:Transposase n=1 Tax=Streptomyces klenkii TaxID=1420899 RepID=A0A3B0A6W2_9ACTN|nr:transposase [Streptomyces klenkii]
MGLTAGQIRDLIGRVARLTPETGDSSRRRAGRRPALDLPQGVVLTLVMLRSNMSQATIAHLVGVSQPTVSRIYRRYLPLISRALRLSAPRLEEVLTGRLILLDGTLIPTGTRAGQPELYSGKRRRPGVNVQVLADTAGRLLAVSRPFPGRTHDRAALALTGWEPLLARTAVIADLGYQGASVVTPRKTPPGGALSPSDKESNRNISGIRAAVERAIAHLKNWKTLSSGYRGRLRDLPAVIQAVTALEFFRLGWNM